MSLFLLRTRDYFCWQCGTPTCSPCSSVATSWVCFACHELAVVVMNAITGAFVNSYAVRAWVQLLCYS